MGDESEASVRLDSPARVCGLSMCDESEASVRLDSPARVCGLSICVRLDSAARVRALSMCDAKGGNGEVVISAALLLRLVDELREALELFLRELRARRLDERGDRLLDRSIEERGDHVRERALACVVARDRGQVHVART